jgi:lipoprotein-releasing system permease protein
MNFKTLKFISKRISVSSKRERFLGFARGVALISIMLGSMALIISLSALNGFEKLLREKAVSFTSHINILSVKNEPMPLDDRVTKELPMQFRYIKSIAPVVKREGLIRTKDFVEGVLIRGSSAQTDITNMKSNIIKGSFVFNTDTSKEVVIGSSLARKLSAGIGDTVVLFANTQGADREDFYPEIDNFVVRGIYKTGMEQYDDIIVYIPFRQAQQFFKMPASSVSGYEIMLNDINLIEKASPEIENYLGFPYFSVSVLQLHSSIFAWIELQKAPIPIVLALISIVAFSNIITILLITVVEKTHSIGIMRAIGMRRRDILSVFAFQGTLIGLIGTLAGSAIGLVFGILQQQFGMITLNANIYFLDTFPIVFEYWHFAVVIGASIILSFLATLIPSFIAVRVQPINAIRFK